MKKFLTSVAIVSSVLLQASFVSASMPVLKFGSQGTYVYELQTFLKRTGFFTASATGNFYSVTEQSLKDFQDAYGLPVTGKYDQATADLVSIVFGNIFISTGVVTPPSSDTGDSVDSLDGLPVFDSSLESNS